MFSWTDCCERCKNQLFSHCPLDGLVYVLSGFPFGGFAAIAS